MFYLSGNKLSYHHCGVIVFLFKTICSQQMRKDSVMPFKRTLPVKRMFIDLTQSLIFDLLHLKLQKNETKQLNQCTDSL